MANTATQFRIEAIVRGVENVEALKNSVRRLQSSATPAAADLNKLKDAALALGSATDRTENDLRTAVTVLKDLRANVALNDAEFRKLTASINRYESQLNKATGATGRFSKAGQTIGAVAASGVFGGPEGLVGSAIGGIIGGPAGALTGGAIGAQVGMFRQQLGQTAELSSTLEKQRLALQLVLKNTTEYQKALQFLSKASEDYAIPQDKLIKGFTQLAASVVGAGGNIEDTKTAFEGVTAGIRGTGRSLEDLDAALLATAQVFSKGKVTAEELRGQIGERLPGAFTLFAQSIGKTPQELDKALQRGEVSLADFLKFSKTVFGEYGENAKTIADSPAAAGDRLQKNLTDLSQNVGKLLQPIGAAFQDTFSNIAKYISDAAKRLSDFLGLNLSNAQKIGELNNQIIIQQRAIERERSNAERGLTSREAAAYSIKEFEARIAKLRAELNVLKSLEKASADQKGAGRPSLADATGPSVADQKEQERLEKERIRNATELNRLLQQQVELNIKAGAIGKGDLAKLDAEMILLKQLVRYKIEDARLTSANEEIRKQKIININAEFQAEKARIEEQRKQTLQDISEIGKQADKLIAGLALTGVDETPLQKELRAINEEIVKSIEDADKLLELLGAKGGTDPVTGAIRKQLGEFKADQESITPEQRLNRASRGVAKGPIESLQSQINELQRYGREVSTIQEIVKSLGVDWDSITPAIRSQIEAMAAMVDQLRKINEIVGTIGDVLGSAITQSFDLLITGAGDWKTQLRDIAANALRDIARELLRILVIEQIIASIKGALGGLFSGGGGSSALSFSKVNFNAGAFSGPSLLADGGAFAQNGIVPFATGGIVDKPTLFKFANGTGLMGEAGPEAIIPLKRGRDGKLGVAGGGTGTVVNVSVDAKGTSVQGDSTQGAALGRVIAGAVQAELIKQRRPGGLLAA